jgi:hypothetical protein
MFEAALVYKEIERVHEIHQQDKDGQKRKVDDR